MKFDWVKKEFSSADEFLLEMLSYGKPLEVSLVGAFDDKGRGSRRNIDLDLHRDGDYSTQYKNKIDIVGLYCLRSSSAKTLITNSKNILTELILEKGEALIFDNKICTHGRKGDIFDRVLLRVWIQQCSE